MIFFKDSTSILIAPQNLIKTAEKQNLIFITEQYVCTTEGVANLRTELPRQISMLQTFHFQ